MRTFDWIFFGAYILAGLLFFGVVRPWVGRQPWGQKTLEEIFARRPTKEGEE